MKKNLARKLWDYYTMEDEDPPSSMEHYQKEEKMLQPTEINVHPLYKFWTLTFRDEV